MEIVAVSKQGSLSDSLRDALKILNKNNCIVLMSRSQVVLARNIASELGKRITVRAVSSGGWLCKLSDDSYKKFQIVEENDASIMTAPRYSRETGTPKGKSGMVLEMFAFYEEGHQDIPEDIFIYDRPLNLIFQAKYIKVPSALTNKTVRALHGKDIRVAVNKEGVPLTKEAAEEVFKLLDGWTK